MSVPDLPEWSVHDDDSMQHCAYSPDEAGTLLTVWESICREQLMLMTDKTDVQDTIKQNKTPPQVHRIVFTNVDVLHHTKWNKINRFDMLVWDDNPSMPVMFGALVELTSAYMDPVGCWRGSSRYAPTLDKARMNISARPPLRSSYLHRIFTDFLVPTINAIQRSDRPISSMLTSEGYLKLAHYSRSEDANPRCYDYDTFPMSEQARAAATPSFQRQFYIRALNCFTPTALIHPVPATLHPSSTRIPADHSKQEPTRFVPMIEEIRVVEPPRLTKPALRRHASDILLPPMPKKKKTTDEQDDKESTTDKAPKLKVNILYPHSYVLVRNTTPSLYALRFPFVILRQRACQIVNGKSVSAAVDCFLHLSERHCQRTHTHRPRHSSLTIMPLLYLLPRRSSTRLNPTNIPPPNGNTVDWVYGDRDIRDLLNNQRIASVMNTVDHANIRALTIILSVRNPP
ncbi:hypothetical protein FISHEDRAFT_62107 [Fistulina hepatica ATCC 64428]|nr:hypothetical protein FISHEDRAFT_62107 [Fistulina hepatica ATCC 64428]